MSEIMAEISDAERKFKFGKDMVMSRMSKHAFLAPPPRLNLAKVATVSLGTAPSPEQALQVADSGSTSGHETSASSGPLTPAEESTKSISDQEESSPSPGRKKSLEEWAGANLPLLC